VNPFLQLQSVSLNFGGLRALHEVSFLVQPGSITSLVGPNGAGKTTVFNTISGLVRPTSGQIRFDGKRIDQLRPDEVTCAGIGRTFQDPRVFKGLSVLDNALSGARLRANRAWPALIRDRATVAEWKAAKHRVSELLRDLGLGDRLEHKAEDLSFAEQRFLSLARALAGEPKLLLLDEPTVGLDRHSLLGFKERLRKLVKEQGLTVLLVEHNMEVVLEVSDQVHLLVYGEIVASGTSSEIRQHKKMIEAYLGDQYVAQSA
jgi:ABC-type branched-subunit amino acid transport system ATPase component